MRHHSILNHLAVVALLCIPLAAASQANAAGADAGPLMRTLNIKNMTFREFANLISQSSGKQVVVSQSAGDIPINVYLCDMQVEDALAAVCNAYQCWYKKDATTGVISVITADEYLSGLSFNDEEQVRIVKLRYLDARQLGDTLRNLYRDRVVWQRPEEDQYENLEDLEMAIERMNILSENAQYSDRDSGSGSSSSYGSSRYGSSGRYGYGGSRYGMSSRYGMGGGRYGMGGMYGTGGFSEELEAPQEVQIEREALLNQLQEARARGEEELYSRPGVVYLSVYRNTNALLIRTADTLAMNSLVKAIEEMDVPKPQVLIEVKVLEIKLEDENSRGIDWLFQSGDYSGGRSTGLLEPFGGGPATYGNILPPDANMIPQGTELSPGAALLQVASEHVLARLQMLEDENRLTGLATPNLCVADGEISRVFVGAETSVLTSINVFPGFIVEGAATDNVTEPETERRNVGMTLLITPQIHSDRSVTIRIVQEDSQLGPIREIEYGVDGNFKSQDVETRSVITTVVAHDGEISAVGGLIREAQQMRDSGIPGLKDAPVIGGIFKAKTKTNARTELVVLLRPYILLAPGEGEKQTRSILDGASEHPGAHNGYVSLGIGRGEFPPRDLILPAPSDEELRMLEEEAASWETE